MKKEDLQELAKNEGAVIARSIRTFSFKRKSIIIVDDAKQKRFPDAESNFKKFKIITVSKDWILDCLSSFHIYPLYPFLKLDISQETLEKAGYFWRATKIVYSKKG